MMHIFVKNADFNIQNESFDSQFVILGANNLMNNFPDKWKDKQKNRGKKDKMDGVKRRTFLRVPAKASVWYIASSALARSVSVVGTPIFTRLLSAGEYGIFPQYATFLSLFSVVATLEISGGAILRGIQKFEKRREQFVSCAIGLIVVVWSVISALILSFSAIFGDFTGLGIRLVFIMLIHILLNAIISIYTAEARFSYKYRSVAIANITVATI